MKSRRIATVIDGEPIENAKVAQQRLLQGLLRKEGKMALKDLIPWRGRDVTIRRAEAPSPNFRGVLELSN
jgi:hypothetical protein